MFIYTLVILDVFTFKEIRSLFSFTLMILKIKIIYVYNVQGIYISYKCGSLSTISQVSHKKKNLVYIVIIYNYMHTLNAVIFVRQIVIKKYTLSVTFIYKRKGEKKWKKKEERNKLHMYTKK